MDSNRLKERGTKKIDHVLRSLEVRRSKAKNGIYCGIVNGHIVWIALYGDDLLISSSSVAAIKKVKEILEFEFETKDLGEVSTVLGLKIEINEKKETIRISHKTSIESSTWKITME